MKESLKGRSIPAVKIEEALYRMISFNNIELSKKGTVVMPEQTSNVDSYSTSEALGRVEQEVFQVLKNITRDLMDGIVKHEAVRENTVTTDSAGIDTLKRAGLPAPQSDILVLLVSPNGETPENPLKIFVAYKTDEPSTEGVIYQGPSKNGFIDAIVESAKKYLGISTESPLIPAEDGKGNTASENEIGYIVKFSSVSQVPLEVQVLQSKVMQKEQKGNLWQPIPFVTPDMANVVSVEGIKAEDAPIESATIEGKAIDGKALLTLFRNVGDGKEFFEKLSALAVDMEKNRPQEGTEKPFHVEPPYTIVIHIDPARDNNEMTPTSPDKVNVQEFQGRAGQTIESVKDNAIQEALSAKVFGGGQEITKSPVTNNPTTNSPNTNNNTPTINIPHVLADNDDVLKRVTLFVDRVNALLGEDGEVDGVPVNALSGGETESMSGKLHLLQMQTRDAGIGPIVQTAVKKIIFENEEFQQARIIGLSIEKNLLRLDIHTLEGGLSSNKEETLNTLKGLGNSLYERINYFVHPYAGIYADNKEILQLRASQKDEGAQLLDKQLNKEQGGLEKRLNELQLLIERSTLLKQWFTEDTAIKAEENT